MLTLNKNVIQDKHQSCELVRKVRPAENNPAYVAYIADLRVFHAEFPEDVRGV